MYFWKLAAPMAASTGCIQSLELVRSVPITIGSCPPFCCWYSDRKVVDDWGSISEIRESGCEAMICATSVRYELWPGVRVTSAANLPPSFLYSVLGGGSEVWAPRSLVKMAAVWVNLCVAA